MSEAENVENAIIRADVARGLAMFYAMEISLAKKAVEPYYEAVMNGLKKYYKIDKLKALSKEGGVSMDNLIDYEFTARLKKVVGKLESVGEKARWYIYNIQFINVLVKNDLKEGESKIVLGDFEFVMRNYRAINIGGHFTQKMVKWFDEEGKIADYRKYIQEEIRHFYEEYTRQGNKLTNNPDTGDQVFIESKYGYILAITFNAYNMLYFIEEENDKNPLNLLGLNKLFDEFVHRYARLGLEVL